MADHRRGGQDRPLRLRGAGAVLRRPHRADAADRQRGALLGRRRHRHGDHGHRRWPSPAIFGQGTGEQIGEWIPQCFGTPDEPAVGRVLRRPSPTPAPTSRRMRTTRASTTRPPTSGCSTARRRGPPTAASPTCTSSSRRSTASSARAARRRSSSRPARKGLEQGTKVKKHGLRASHTADVVPRRLPRPRLAACSAARRSSTSASPARARARSGARPGGDADLRGHAPDGRRAGDRHRPRRLRVRARLRQASASSSAARSSRTRRSPSRWPT